MNAADPKMRDTYVQQWNFTVQQRLGDNSFEVGYVANKSNKIYTSEDVNRPGDFDSRFVLGTAALIRPGYSSIGWRQSDGSGQYHSLQTKFERRTRAAQYLVSYTWGHAISDAEQGQSAVGVGNPGASTSSPTASSTSRRRPSTSAIASSPPSSTRCRSAPATLSPTS